MYEYFDAVEQFENSHFPNEKHGYEYVKRQAMYPFMVKHLGLDSMGVLDPETGKYDESQNTIEEVDTMRTFKVLADMPKGTLEPGSIISLR